MHRSRSNYRVCWSSRLPLSDSRLALRVRVGHLCMYVPIHCWEVRSEPLQPCVGAQVPEALGGLCELCERMSVMGRLGVSNPLGEVNRLLQCLLEAVYPNCGELISSNVQNCSTGTPTCSSCFATPRYTKLPFTLSVMYRVIRALYRCVYQSCRDVSMDWTWHGYYLQYINNCEVCGVWKIPVLRKNG